jgi:hypothetical protein
VQKATGGYTNTSPVCEVARGDDLIFAENKNGRDRTKQLKSRIEYQRFPGNTSE